MNPNCIIEARTEALLDRATTTAAVWHTTHAAMELLRCYDDLDAIENPHSSIEDAMATIEDELDMLRQTAIDIDRDSVDFGDDGDAQDAHDEMVEASAVTVYRAMQVTRDAAVARIMGVAA